MPNNSLINKVVSLLKRGSVSPSNPAKNDNRGASSETSPGDVSHLSDPHASRWRVDPDRYNVWLDIENMDANDEIISQSLDVLADAATGKLDDSTVEAFFFTSENEKVLEILNDLEKRLGLKQKATDICRKMVKHGNEFREIIIAEDKGKYKIVRLKEDLPSYQFISNQGDFGNIDPNYPWVQKLDGYFSNDQDVKFRPFQLAHWYYGEIRKGVATPKLKAARRNWKRLQTTEDSMASGRMNRAYSKLIHFVPVEHGDDADTILKKIKGYKEKVQKLQFLSWLTGHTKELDKPLTVETDFYVPDDGSGRGGIETIDPKNSQLAQIDDVNYALNRLICRCGVPRKYLNIPDDGGKMNASGGDNEEKQFARKVRSIQMSFRHGLKTICDVELLLNGIDIRDQENSYLIGMAEVNSDDKYRDAQSNQTNAAAAAEFLKLAEMPERLFLRKFMRLSEYEMTQYGDQIKLRPQPDPSSMTGNEGGAPTGQRPGSSDNNGKPKPRKTK